MSSLINRQALGRYGDEDRKNRWRLYDDEDQQIDLSLVNLSAVFKIGVRV